MTSEAAEAGQSSVVNRESFTVQNKDLFGAWTFKSNDKFDEQKLVERGANAASEYLFGPQGQFNRVANGAEAISRLQAKELVDETVGRALHHWQTAEREEKLVGWGELASALKMADNLGFCLAGYQTGERKTPVSWYEDGQKVTKLVDGAFVAVPEYLMADDTYKARFYPGREVILSRFTVGEKGRAPIIEGRFGHLRRLGALSDQLVGLAENISDEEDIEVPEEHDKYKGQYVSGYHRGGEELLVLLEEALPRSKKGFKEDEFIAAGLTALDNGNVLLGRVRHKLALYFGARDAIKSIGEELLFLPQKVGKRIEISIAGRKGWLDDGVVYIPLKKVDWVSPKTGEVEEVSIEEYQRRKWEQWSKTRRIALETSILRQAASEVFTKALQEEFTEPTPQENAS